MLRSRDAEKRLEGMAVREAAQAAALEEATANLTSLKVLHDSAQERLFEVTTATEGEQVMQAEEVEAARAEFERVQA